MKLFCRAAMMAGLLALGAAAQTSGTSTSVNGAANADVSQSSQNNGPDKSSAAAGGTHSAGVSGLSSGTTLQAELTKSIDAKKAKPGDEVTAKLTQDVKSSGQVVLHKGTKLVGHVTEAQARTKDNSESRLGVVFDKAVLKGGQEMAFTGVIQALAAPIQGSLSVPADDGGSLGSGMGSGGGTAMGGGRSGGGIAPMGGAGPVNSTLGSATNTVNNTAGSVNQATGAAANGSIDSTTRGVVGMQGVALNTTTTGNAQGSVVSSASRNVKLDTGTQMILQVTGSAAAR